MILDKIQRIQIWLGLLNDFHFNVKTTWNSIEDYKIKGQTWLNSIDANYNDLILSKFALETLLTETFHFKSLTVFNSSSSTPKDRMLVMKGGGIKGLAYVGALEILEEHYDFNWFSGTSAGAITAMLLAAGYKQHELRKILEEKDFSDFMDANIIVGIWNLISKSGFYEGNSFTIWLECLLAKKLDSTTEIRLKHLPFRATVCASKRNQRALIFDSKDPEFSNKNAAFAARCSMSIPLMFTPQKDEGLNVLDGGLQNNFPLKIILEKNPNTDFIGLFLGPEIYKGRKKNNMFLDLIRIWTESSDAETLEDYKDNIIVIDPSPISTVNFKLNSDKKEFLMETGRLSAIKFLHKKGLINQSDYDYSNRKAKSDITRSFLIKKKRRKFLIIKWSLLGSVFIYLIYAFVFVSLDIS